MYFKYQRKLALLLCLTLSMLNLAACQKSGAKITNFTNERIYQIMTDRFYDGDATNNAKGEAFRYQEETADDFKYMHGGDWQGIIEKIPYIKGMGYTAIWISPIMDVQLWSPPDAKGQQYPTAYHAYHTYDPKRANRYFGAEDPEKSKAKLKELVTECHKQGLKVIFDIVPNHMGDYIKGVGKDAHYVKEQPNMKEGTQLQPVAPFNQVDWYHNLGPIDWSKERPHNESSNKMLESHDLWELDDLNYDKAEVKQAMFDAFKYWFDYTGADAARVDAVKCMRPSDLHDLEKYITVPTFGENFDTSPKFIAEWIGDKGMTGMLDFPLFEAIVKCFAKGQHFSIIREVFDRDHNYGNNLLNMVTFIDNHDRNRFLTEAKGDKARLQAALTFIFAARGVPCVFQGTEQNRGNADNGLMNSGMPDVFNRWCMVTKDKAGKVLHDYFKTDTDTYKLIAKLNQLRTDLKALSAGKQVELLADTHTYALSRQTNEAKDEVLATFNNGEEAETIKLQLKDKSQLKAGQKLVNALDNSQTVTVDDNGELELELKAKSAQIWRLA